MADVELKLLYGVLGKMLKTEWNDEVDAIAAKVAANAGEEAVWEHYTTDRGAASVAVPAYEQAKDGALTKACSKSGVSFRAK